MKHIEFVPTGLLRLDDMLGGGIPKGQFIEIYGYEYSGKTTLALEISKVFNNVLYVDFEHKSDPIYHNAIGAKVEVQEGVVLEQSMDEVLKKIGDRAKKKNKKLQYDLVIIDSLGASMPKAEYEADLVDSTIGALAKAITRFLRKASNVFPAYGITCIMVNHRKDKIGISFGDSDYTPGGRQIKYSSLVRLALHRAGQKIYKDVDGNFCRIRQTKNQASSNVPFDKCEYLIIRGRGIIRGFEAFDIGLSTGLIKQGGHWFTIGNKKCKGAVEMIEFLEQHDRLRKVIYEKSK